MPTKRLPDPPGVNVTPCFHPEHNPPSMMIYEPGRYEHTCPGCGKVVVFQVRTLACLAVNVPPSIEPAPRR